MVQLKKTDLKGLGMITNVTNGASINSTQQKIQQLLKEGETTTDVKMEDNNSDTTLIKNDSDDPKIDNTKTVGYNI